MNERPEAGEGRPFTVLDLFSGFGAYSLGLERTGGFETVAFCEIRPYCREILKRHWPHVPIWEDIENLNGCDLQSRGLVPDWIVAGWPCQGNSLAGTGLGMDDPRSGLWRHIRRLADELRPLGLLLENSSNLLAINDGRDFGRVLGDLAALGYNAEWHCLPAAAFDAPHIRDRVWIVATRRDALADAAWDERERQNQRAEWERVGTSGQSFPVADADHKRRRTRAGWQDRAQADHCGDARTFAHAYCVAPIGVAIARQKRCSWEPESDVARVATGVADRVERIHGLGNLNPPIIPEMLGRAILEHFAPPPERAGRAGR